MNTVLYLHIPKSAGTTFIEIAHRNYPVESTMRHHDELPSRQLDNLAEEHVKGLRFIGGHMFFGLHERLSQDCSYVTFLRNPIERQRSYYHFVRRVDPDNEHKIAARQMGFKEYLHSNFPIWNYHVRYISGVGHNVDICTQAELERAKANLLIHFPVFGITESFDASLLLMSSKFEWSYPFYVRRNVNPAQLKIDDLDDDTVKVIEERDAFDIQLYQFAVEVFEDKIGKIPDFSNRVERFKRLNQSIGPYVVAVLNGRGVRSRVARRGMRMLGATR